MEKTLPRKKFKNFITNSTYTKSFFPNFLPAMNTFLRKFLRRWFDLYIKMKIKKNVYFLFFADKFLCFVAEFIDDFFKIIKFTLNQNVK